MNKKNKVSLLITAWKEPKTVNRLIDSILAGLKNKEQSLELILICPDKETQRAGIDVLKKHNYKNYKILTDTQQGKPKALNMAMEHIYSEIVILTDGDTFLDAKSLDYILDRFNQDKDIGCVAGRPISADEKNNFWSYIGHLLADGAHHKRVKAMEQGKFFFASGYLYALKRELWKPISENTLIDDAVVSLNICSQNKKIVYEPRAKVYIKYPTNFRDWIIQKRRSVGGYREIKIQTKSKINTRFWGELQMIFFSIKYASTIKELFYSFRLYFIRLHLWIIIFIDSYKNKKSVENQKLWKRVESTK